MYTGTYEKGQADMEEDHDNNSILRVHIEMHMIADKYDVPTLAQVAAKLFKDSIARPTMDLLSIIRSIPLVYQSTPPANRALRDLVTRRIRTDAKKIASEFEKPFGETCLDCPEFSSEMLMQLMKEPVMGECSSCGPHRGLSVLQARCNSCLRGGATVRF
jgi:hypothetical protein